MLCTTLLKHERNYSFLNERYRNSWCSLQYQSSVADSPQKSELASPDTRTFEYLIAGRLRHGWESVWYVPVY